MILCYQSGTHETTSGCSWSLLTGFHGTPPPNFLSFHLYYKTVPQNYPVRGLHFNYETVPAELQLKYRVKWLPPLRLYGPLFPHT